MLEARRSDDMIPHSHLGWKGNGEFTKSHFKFNSFIVFSFFVLALWSISVHPTTKDVSLTVMLIWVSGERDVLQTTSHLPNMVTGIYHPDARSRYFPTVDPILLVSFHTSRSSSNVATIVIQQRFFPFPFSSRSSEHHVTPRHEHRVCLCSFDIDIISLQRLRSSALSFRCS